PLAGAAARAGEPIEDLGVRACGVVRLENVLLLRGQRIVRRDVLGGDVRTRVRMLEPAVAGARMLVAGVEPAGPADYGDRQSEGGLEERRARDRTSVHG